MRAEPPSRGSIACSIRPCVCLLRAAFSWQEPECERLMTKVQLTLQDKRARLGRSRGKSMIRKMLVLAVALAATPAFAQTTVDQLAKPPADAKIWTISSSGGAAQHGQVAMWTDANGTHWSRFSMNLRGFVSEVDEQNHFAADGSLDSMVVRGFTPYG